jgi:hypothetical protein
MMVKSVLIETTKEMLHWGAAMHCWVRDVLLAIDISSISVWLKIQKYSSWI